MGEESPPFLLLSLLIERLQNLTSSYCQDEEYRFADFQQPFWSVVSSEESQVPDGRSEPQVPDILVIVGAAPPAHTADVRLLSNLSYHCFCSHMGRPT